MYTPPHFEVEHLPEIHALMTRTGFASLITWTGESLLATPLPFLLTADEGEFGTLYGHVARANPQWKTAGDREALAIFSGIDAYITPSWYATKAETGKVVPTWNYEAVHAYGIPEFFEDEDRLRDVVARLTQRHEAARPQPWSINDAPADFIRSQLRGIVGVRIPIARLEGKRKMSQNRNAADRAGVREGLAASTNPIDQQAAKLIPLEPR